ncbi:hypothetical protein L6452_40720 [Arctium lappa]|uniref:Uncharacterized protein n=1 Tax=Arctium lappa TaxID=4217 RepID=A0ACB8XRU5_ARCLA|nr:hypothetical protein L6452_40720 [Arctium lappa]
MADQRGGKVRYEKIRRKGWWRWCRRDSDEKAEEKDSSCGDVFMADQRGTGEVRDGRDLKFGGDGETIGSDADEDEKFVYHVCFKKAREDRGSYFAMNEMMENLDFGRDTNRLDYFRVTAFEVNRDHDLNGIAGYGGGHKTRQLPDEIFSNNSGGGNDGEVVVQRLNQKGVRGGAGGGGRTRRAAIGIFATNGGGEVVMKRLNQKTACWCRCWCRCF